MRGLFGLGVSTDGNLNQNRRTFSIDSTPRLKATYHHLEETNRRQNWRFVYLLRQNFFMLMWWRLVFLRNWSVAIIMAGKPTNFDLMVMVNLHRRNSKSLTIILPHYGLVLPPQGGEPSAILTVVIPVTTKFYRRCVDASSPWDTNLSPLLR